MVLVALGVLNAKTILDLKKTPDDAIDVEVYGQQWWWEYRYDVDGDDQPDIITANQMVVPAGRHIHLKIRSNDVIHSFWIPQLNGKMDSVPGRTNDWSIEADEPGLYQGTCTEFCGLSHALMRMEVKLSLIHICRSASSTCSSQWLPRAAWPACSTGATASSPVGCRLVRARRLRRSPCSAAVCSESARS